LAADIADFTIISSEIRSSSLEVTKSNSYH